MTVCLWGRERLPNQTIQQLYEARGLVLLREKQYQKAIDDFGKAIDLEPGRASAFRNRGSCWYGLKQYQKGIEDYGRAIQIDPNRADLYNGRATLWNALGEQDKALADLNRAIEIDPDSKRSRMNRGFIGIALENGATAGADFEEVVRRDAMNSSAHYHRGFVAFQQGDFDRAIDEATRADGFGYPPASCCRLRGDAWYAKKDYEKAIANFEYAAVQDPLDHQALDSFAWILATASDAQFRDGGRAVESASRACELTEGKNADYLTTLAASHAEAGDFENAVKRQQEAIDQTTNDQPTKSNRLARLALYAANQPFHVDPGPNGAHDLKTDGVRRATLAAFATAAIESELQRANREAAAARNTPQPPTKEPSLERQAFERATAPFKKP